MTCLALFASNGLHRKPKKYVRRHLWRALGWGLDGIGIIPAGQMILSNWGRETRRGRSFETIEAHAHGARRIFEPDAAAERRVAARWFRMDQRT